MAGLVRRFAQLESGLRGALLAFFSDVAFCLHPEADRLLRRGAKDEWGHAPMGVECGRCGRWLGPVNAPKPRTRVAAELAARQAVASVARRSRDKAPEASTQFPTPSRERYVESLVDARKCGFRDGYTAGTHDLGRRLMAIEHARQLQTTRARNN